MPLKIFNARKAFEEPVFLIYTVGAGR